jgi:type I restriction enzyme S subunit
MPVGTVMVSKRAPVGAVAVNTVPMATNQGFLNFVCGLKVRPLYLAYWFLANRPYLDLIANGSTYPELYKGDLFEFEIAVPELAAQDQAISFLSSLDFLTMVGMPLEQTSLSPSRTQRIHSQSTELEKIRRVLLPAVLSGDVDLATLPVPHLSAMVAS